MGISPWLWTNLEILALKVGAVLDEQISDISIFQKWIALLQKDLWLMRDDSIQFWGSQKSVNELSGNW